ncbi:MAG: hypothetical protein F6K55_03995 [Moorea sp. SIO4A3]|nr:hypothetical protein [Moorena sp. SIO4A3]
MLISHSVVRTAWPKAKACATLLDVLSANALLEVLLEVLISHSVVRTAWPKAKACATLLDVLMSIGQATPNSF